MIRLGVLSDSHGDLQRTSSAIDLLLKQGAEILIHCGDLVDPAIFQLFANLPQPTAIHSIEGNCDSHVGDWPIRARQAGVVHHGRFAEFQVGDDRVAVIHGDDGQRMNAAIDSGIYRLICCGHTHRRLRAEFGNTVVVNPGAIYHPRDGLPPSVAIVTLPEVKVDWLNLD